MINYPMVQDLLALFFPEICLYCKQPTVKGEDMLCTGCLLDLPKTNDHLSQDKTILNKFIAFPQVSRGHAFLRFSKRGIVQRLLHHLKYERNQELGVRLGNWYGKELESTMPKEDHDLIVPTPLHVSKLRTRGYNQSDLIAQGLSESLGIPWSGQVLKRVKKTMTQTKMGKVERWKNVERIFQVVNHSAIENKNIILVDDVITTGATLNSCVEALVEVGVSRVSILTLAKAD